jgi:N-acetylglutamate synthase
MGRMDDLQVESIERATLAAVPPLALREIDGWLLPLDPGTVGRAHSAVPLTHAPPRPDVLAGIERIYRQAGLRPVLRLPRVDAFEGLRGQLRDAGWIEAKPTEVQTASAHAVAGSLRQAYPVTLSSAPSEAWAAVFLGEGFDPVDGASRVDILRRARSAVFATVRVGDEVAAVGTACFSHGWCGVHGMRTLPAFRGRGLAGAVLAAFAGQALERGEPRMLLQVEHGNAPAQSLYRRAGFRRAWAYDYWSAA